MTLKIALELTDEDLQYYAKVMESVWRRNAKRKEKELLDGARRLLKQANKAKGPAYVQSRLDDLSVLITMLDDPEWPLEAADRQRIVTAVGYFAVPKDMIPDKIPGLGFLDDALCAELVIRELQDELDGYRDFCEYRENEAKLRGNTKVSRADWLAAKRRQIFMRIRRRQESRRRHASTEGLTLPILRYQY